MSIKDYDWKRLNGLGFDVDFVEKTTKLASASIPTPINKMVVAPALSKTHATKPSTLIMGEQGIEPNGGMLLTQLKSLEESVSQALGLVRPEDNLPPWVASKISQASTSLQSVANHLKFGDDS